MAFRDVIQWVSMLMIAPSTLLILLIVYVIYKASPTPMANYKYVLITMTVGLLLCQFKSTAYLLQFRLHREFRRGSS